MNASAQADVLAARAQCEAAVEAIMVVLDRVTAQARRLQEREPEAAAELRAASIAGMEACAFQDIVGQILERVGGRHSDDPLLNGPANTGQSLDQSSIDDLMGALD